eukprot:3417246-Rhodomonas_salina.1
MSMTISSSSNASPRIPGSSACAGCHPSSPRSAATAWGADSCCASPWMVLSTSFIASWTNCMSWLKIASEASLCRFSVRES